MVRWNSLKSFMTRLMIILTQRGVRYHGSHVIVLTCFLTDKAPPLRILIVRWQQEILG